MKQIQKIVDQLHSIFQKDLSRQVIEKLIEIPQDNSLGDYAFPTYQLEKIYKKSPLVIAEETARQLDHSLFEQIEVKGPYINFKLNRGLISLAVLKEILLKAERYGSTDLGNGKVIIVDMSSPNIAKPMTLGHLRSTVIGQSLSLIYEKLNYQVIRINHLGDWGLQFGKLIVAYKEWGEFYHVKQDPINELVKLYVEFHDHAERDPALEERGRAAFKALEDGNQEMLTLWQWFKEESLTEFNYIYHLLGIEFDYLTGESFYNDKLEEIIQELETKKISTVEQGATIVKLDEENLPPALIKKSDGATLYLTRDLATAYYRKREFDFAQSLYVVGNEQADHFRQLKAVLKRLGKGWAENIRHISYGLVTLEGRKLSARKGKNVFLKDVLDEAIELAAKQISEKNPYLEKLENIAQQVGIGAMIFHDLKNVRLNNVDFILADIVQIEGETGPYVQYTYARCMSLMEQYQATIYLEDVGELKDDLSWEIVKTLAAYPNIIENAARHYEPSIIAQYVIELAQEFNRYYAQTKILHLDTQQNARLALVKGVATVLKDALSLLGLQAPDKL